MFPWVFAKCLMLVEKSEARLKEKCRVKKTAGGQM